MNCKATIVKEGDDYIVTEVLTHVMTFGKTREEAVKNLESAMMMYYGDLAKGNIHIGVIG